jgi:uncharacterized membrane protein YfcA
MRKQLLKIVSFLGLGLVAGLSPACWGSAAASWSSVLIWIFSSTCRGGHPHLAIGTSLAAIVFTSCRPSGRSRSAVPSTGRWCACWLATLLGGFVSGYLAGSSGARAEGVLRCLPAVVGTVRAGLEPRTLAPARRGGLWGVGSASGSFSALLGIGGSNITVPFPRLQSRTQARHRHLHRAGPAHRAVRRGRFRAVRVGPRVARTVGYVSLPALAAIAGAAVLTAPLGVRLAHDLPVRKLKRVFGVLVLAISLRMLWTVLV